MGASDPLLPGPVVRHDSTDRSTSKRRLFEAGSKDTFQVMLPNVGLPYKLRIGHDGKGALSGWHLDQINQP
ncbi:unnamed protein product [Protopolystoma xenopodis]|uniref:PLAT domain-containing protein n=1 Tax=Protopolystoma xenopodis TaxID=117903 RepID=A0A3S5A5S2_9PLAT|nr:unnamed protein product [Protopolystoma xenopodis]